MKIGIIGSGKFGLVLLALLLKIKMKYLFIQDEQMKLNQLMQKMRAYQVSLLVN